MEKCEEKNVESEIKKEIEPSDQKTEETKTKVETNKPGRLKINSIFLQDSSDVHKPIKK